MGSIVNTANIQDRGLPRLERLLEYGSQHYPTKAAITYFKDGGCHHVSYRQLHTKASCLASIVEGHLQVSSPEDAPFVGLFLARSVGQIIAILGTLIAGAAYVPLALDLPKSTFRAIVEQTGVRVIITDADQCRRLNDLLEESGRDRITVVKITDANGMRYTSRKPSPLSAASPAYVLFSSGTTGTPKGIVTPHSAVRTYCEAANQLYQATSNDKWVQASSYTFDSSIDEIFCPLAVGAEIVIQPPSALSSFPSYLKFLGDSGATILTLTTALWHQVANYVIQEGHSFPSNIRIVSAGGEAGLTTILKAWRARFGNYPRFLNGYGPTEATVCATYWEGHDDVASPVLPIGQPLPGYKCYVLDPVTNHPIDNGKEGVLFISGPALAIGYLNNPDLTSKRFLSNPWAESKDYARMYNTGDLARVDADGVFHFHGRADCQVKIRGFRVELEAVEACLLTHPQIREVAVIASIEQQSQAISAYIVEQGEPLYAEDLVEHCRTTLAHYEIPAHFYQVEQLPYTRSRKVDRRALLTSMPAKQLPFREGSSRNSLDGINPMLVDLWCQCLDNVSSALLGPQSHFVHMGGHSLTLIALAAKIYSAIGVYLSVADLLQNITLAQMSELVDQQMLALGPTNSRSICMTNDPDPAVRGTYPLSPAQARLYVVQQSSPDSPFFNDGLAIQINGAISYDRIYDALWKVLRRHGILRIKLIQDDSARVLQEVQPFDQLFFNQVFTHVHLERPAAEQCAREIFAKLFDMFEPPLIKIALLSSGDVEHILVICAHHIIWDGFSDKLFLDEFVALYHGKDLSPPSSYLRCLQTEPDLGHLSSLVTYLDSVPQLLELPTNFIRPNEQTYSRGCTVYFNIDPHVLSHLVDRLDSTPFSCLMTAFAVTLHLCAAGQDDFMIGVPFANRLSHEAANAIGFFINILPLRVKFTNIHTLDELHMLIRRDLLFLTKVQDVPLDTLVKALGMNRLTSSDSLIQAILNFTDEPAGNLDSQTKFSRFPLSNGAAHTDLTCFVELGKDGRLDGELEYNSEIFAHDCMDSLVSAFVHVLNTWSAHPPQAIDEIVFPQSSAHIPRIVEPDSADNSFGAFLVSSARHHWERQAVYDDTTGTSYTYRQLFSISQRIRNRLHQYKSPEGRVMLLLERNIDVIAAEIGVSLAGMAWVPCDVSQPLLRIRDIAADSRPICILAHKRVLCRLGTSENDLSAPVLLIDGIYDDFISVDNHEDVLIAEPAGKCAYMIYTSGSTGKPKGITIGHASIIQLMREIAAFGREGTAFNTVVTSNVAWDMSMIQIYPALVTGGCTKLTRLGGEMDGVYLSSLIKQSPVLNYNASTPSALRMWLDQMEDQPGSFFPDNMKHIILGGEEVTHKFVQGVFSHVTGSPNVQIVQVYGPTEGTAFHSCGIIAHSGVRSLAQCRRLPIDRLLSYAAMTVVNPAGHELPRGFVGEIVIWGPCLMLGYHNLPVLNAEKMLVKDGVRGWRSGDLGRHLPSGQFEIFGRTDSMCKVKGGFRVDLTEIEMQIRSHDDVAECCVSLMSMPNECCQVPPELQIVTHVLFKDNVRQDLSGENHRLSRVRVSQSVLSTLYRYLSHRIPAYMIPDYIIPVTGFPLTNSTKVDKSKLPAPSPSDKFMMTTSSSAEWTAQDEARRVTVGVILKIFAAVLSTDKKLMPKDNFFHCGGHSLLATRATTLIRRELEVHLPFTAIITNPTASELATFVEALKLQAARSERLPPHVIPLQPAGCIPQPKAYLFVFPFIGGDLDMLPRVVNQLDNEKLGLATYGLCWEPGKKLNTPEKAAAAFAQSISAVAGLAPCFLLGWCYGGMLACQVACKLPKATTHLILFDVMHLSLTHTFDMDEADFAKAFATYLCKVWFGPRLQLADKERVIQAVLEAKLNWHDIPALISLARKHVTLPPWVTDSDLEQRMLPLADSHDIMIELYSRPSCSPAEALEVEKQVVLNLQATDGLNNIFNTAVGLGWSRYEVLDTDHDTIGYLPIASKRILAALYQTLS